MLVVLQSAGGVSWEEVVSPLGNISNVWVVVYLFYVFPPRFQWYLHLVRSPQEVGSCIHIKCVGDLVAKRNAPQAFDAFAF